MGVRAHQGRKRPIREDQALTQSPARKQPRCRSYGRWNSRLSRHGSTFRKIELPKLVADIPERVKGGKNFPHVNELNSQSARRWQKDGSLVVEIENIVDGNEGSVTATRTVVLGFDRSDKAKVLKSTIKFAVEKP